MKWKYSLAELEGINLGDLQGKIIFLYGDLWAGKTSFVQKQFKKILWDDFHVTSPTYVYYNKYGKNYHFDLYRLKDYDEFVSIWWEDILDNLNGVAFIEWPEIIEDYYTPDIKIFLEKIEQDGIRNIRVEYREE